MIRLSLALCLLLSAGACATAQSNAAQRIPIRSDNDNVLAAKVIVALSRLDRDVALYDSLGEFEAAGRIGLVSITQFDHELSAVDAEAVPLLNQMPRGDLKSALENTLDSYHDGLFRWRQVDQPRVVDVSALRSISGTDSSADAAFRATIPYTVIIHWRQAHQYLQRASRMIGQ